MLGGTSGEGVQWTVDDLDGGGGLMANKNKSLVSESDGNVFVGTNLRWVTRGGSVQFGSGTKLFEKVFSQEFRNLKFYFKNSRFSIFLKSIVPAVFNFFLNPSFPPEIGLNFLKWRVATVLTGF